MTKLDCSVRNCMHNKDDLCCRPTIKVDGTSAHRSDETSCDSFRRLHTDPPHVASLNNVGVGYEYPNKSLDISCSAKNCSFNKESHCIADHISIKNCSDGTECASFVER